jgi:hypothetical protein
MRALHDYDKAKANLAKAEDKMERALHILGSKWDFSINGITYIPLFPLEEQYLIDSISEIKKAYYAYQDLFRDYELEAKLKFENMRNAARSAMDEHRKGGFTW